MRGVTMRSIFLFLAVGAVFGALTGYLALPHPPPKTTPDPNIEFWRNVLTIVGAAVGSAITTAIWWSSYRRVPPPSR